MTMNSRTVVSVDRTIYLKTTELLLAYLSGVVANEGFPPQIRLEASEKLMNLFEKTDMRAVKDGLGDIRMLDDKE